MNVKGSKPSLCRWHNSLAVVQLVYNQGPISRSDIARNLGLDIASVSRIVSELIARDILQERSIGPRRRHGVGRPPQLLEFNPQVRSVIAVDLGGTSVRAALLDLFGRVFRRASIRSEPKEQGLETLINLIQDFVDYAKSSGSIVGAITVGVPGIVIPHEGRVVAAPSLKWHDIPLKRLLEEKFQIPAIVDNDVNLHAMGEYWQGAGRGMSPLVCVFVGTGVGAGIIIDGKIYYGATYSAGEIGYSFPDPGHLGKEFKEYGCLESIAGGYGIAQRGKAAVLSGNGKAILEKAGSLEDIEARHVIEAFYDGDDIARNIIEEAQRALIVSLINLSCILNPKMIVLGGGVIKSGILDLNAVIDLVNKAVPFPPKIVMSTLNDDAGLLGGVALVMQSIEFWRKLLDRFEVPVDSPLTPDPLCNLVQQQSEGKGGESRELLKQE